MRTLILACPLLLGLTIATAPGQTSNLTHRYSFTTNANDSVGTAHGTLRGGATISGGAVVLDGSSGYVDLPNGIVSTLSNVTFETWLTDNGSGNWARILDFGFSRHGIGRGTTSTTSF
jgi:hypothetical protein